MAGAGLSAATPRMICQNVLSVLLAFNRSQTGAAPPPAKPRRTAWTTWTTVQGKKKPLVRPPRTTGGDRGGQRSHPREAATKARCRKPVLADAANGVPADRALKAGATVLAHTGKSFDAGSIR